LAVPLIILLRGSVRRACEIYGEVWTWYSSTTNRTPFCPSQTTQELLRNRTWGSSVRKRPLHLSVHLNRENGQRQYTLTASVNKLTRDRMLQFLLIICILPSCSQKLIWLSI
jgi:hypothetical protein